MASSDQRGGERVPTFLRVRLRFASVDTFIEKYSTNVSMGGIFIQSRSPKPPGTTLRFEMALESGDPLIRGEGQVTWVREFDPNSPGQPFGMGVRFTHLDPQSRAIVERAVAHRQQTGPASRRGFATSPPERQPGGQRAESGAAAVANAPLPARRPRNGPVDLERIDFQLAELMKEAGITEERVQRKASEAAQIARSADGDLAGLLRPPGTPPPVPLPGSPPGGTPPPGAGGRPLGTPPPLPSRAASPLPTPAIEPPAPSKKSKGRGGKRRTRATPRPRGRVPEPAVAEDVTSRAEIEPVDEGMEPVEMEAVEEVSAPAEPEPVDEGMEPVEMEAVEEVSAPVELEPADEGMELVEVEAVEPASSDEAPADLAEEMAAEWERTPGDAGEAPGDLGNGAAEALFDQEDLDGADRMLDSLEQPGAEGEEPGAKDLDSEDLPPEVREITGVREPPTFADMPEEETDVLPDRPTETSGPSPPAEAGEPEAPSPPMVSARDRWAAATGPETANLEAELEGAMDSVIDPTPPPVTAKQPAKHATEPGKKGILGRIFKKKK